MISSCHNINLPLLWLILKLYTILEDFFLLDSVHYCDDAMTRLKVWLVQYRYPNVWLTSPCVSFTIYQQCHGDVEGDVTPKLLENQNVHWDTYYNYIYSYLHSLHFFIYTYLLILVYTYLSILVLSLCYYMNLINFIEYGKYRNNDKIF